LDRRVRGHRQTHGTDGRRDASPTGRRYRAGLPCRDTSRFPLQTVIPACMPRRNSS